MKNFDKNNLKNLTVNELENLLNKELKKPAMLINSELVENLTDTLCVKEDLDITPIDDEEISEMVQDIINNEGKIIRRKQRNICKVAACATALLIFLNTYTVSAYNENIFSFLVEFTKDSVSIQFNDSQKDEIIIPVEENDPYGIIAKCKENGIENIETPHYLPERFILTGVEAENNDFHNYINFIYKNGKQLISLTFEEYPDGVPDSIVIPSDEHNITEIKINEHPAIMSREDDQMIVVCAYENKSINIYTQNVDYTECNKILDSYK